MYYYDDQLLMKIMNSKEVMKFLTISSEIKLCMRKKLSTPIIDIMNSYDISSELYVKIFSYATINSKKDLLKKFAEDLIVYFKSHNINDIIKFVS